MCIEFGDKFFEVVEEIFAHHHSDYADVFFTNLSPSFLGREVYLDRFIALLERALKNDNTHYIRLLKEEIEHLEDIIQVRALQIINS